MSGARQTIALARLASFFFFGARSLTLSPSFLPKLRNRNVENLAGLLCREHEGLQALRRQGGHQGQPALRLHGPGQGEGLPPGGGPAQAGRRQLPRAGMTGRATTSTHGATFSRARRPVRPRADGTESRSTRELGTLRPNCKIRLFFCSPVLIDSQSAAVGSRCVRASFSCVLSWLACLGHCCLLWFASPGLAYSGTRPGFHRRGLRYKGDTREDGEKGASVRA